MKKEILFSYTQLLERIKYYYEYTLYPISQFAEILNISRNKASKIIKYYDFSRSHELNHLSQSYIVKNIWLKRNKEERHNIAAKGNSKRQITWNSKSDEEMDNFRIQHRLISNELNTNRTETDKLKYSKAISNSWKVKSDKEKENIIEKRRLTWRNKSDEEKAEFGKITGERNKKLWSNTEYKDRVSKNISNALKNKSTEERDAINIKISMSQKRRISKRTKKQKDIESKKKSIAGKQVWRNYSKKELLALSTQRSKNSTEIWAKRSNKEKQEIFTKMYNTQIKNNSFGKSSIETYILDKFNSQFNNVYYQYKLNEIWFDFAVEFNNQITYIEFNGSYWHNYRPFNNSEEHIKEYEMMKDLGNRKSAIADSWRYRDVKKLEFCKSNNLNYIVIYCARINKNLDDFLDKIENYLNKGIIIKII